MNEIAVQTTSWQEMLIMSLLGAFLVLCGGMIAGRAGRAPFWGLLLLLPIVQIIAIWIFAFMRWPRVKDGRAGALRDFE